MVLPSSELSRGANGCRGTIKLVTAGFSTDTFGADAGLERLEDIVCTGDSAVTVAEIKIPAINSSNSFVGETFALISHFSFRKHRTACADYTINPVRKVQILWRERSGDCGMSASKSGSFPLIPPSGCRGRKSLIYDFVGS